VRVDVLPAIEESRLKLGAAEIAIESRALRERGRRLRKLRSEVRATHIASGTAAAVACEAEIAAAEARARAVLRGRLFIERAAAGLPASPPWGSVVRAYQLSRRSLVKDPRTGITHRDPRAVFEGDIDRFIAAFLKLKAERQADGS
jgi:peptide chain release factor 2